jgi:Tim44-like domain/Short C-terminal domain
VGLLDRLFRGSAPDKEVRGEDAAARLDGLAQVDPKWSTESIRRRVRDVFFAVQRSWIERNPEIGAPYMTENLMARQRLRIEGLINQRRVHQLENPLIEDLDFARFSEGEAGAVPGSSHEPQVVVALSVSLVETILDADTRQMVAGSNMKIRNQEFWVFVHRNGQWLLDEVEQSEEGVRHLKAPLVGGQYANLSPEMVLRERYARGEIEIEEFEREMARLLESGPTY